MKATIVSFACLAALLLCASSFAQAPPDTTQPTEPSGSTKLKLFIQCDACDFDFLREELHMVDYVRDRKQADVHVLSSRQGTASGGTEFTLELIGRGDFAAMTDTLIYIAKESATDDDTRRGLLEILRKGLVRYVMRTPENVRLTVSYYPPDTTTAEAAEEFDPWNNWVFTISLNGYLNGQESYDRWNTYGNVNASRITEAWKFQFYSSGSYEEQSYETSNGTITRISRSTSGGASAIKSLTDHWSAGFDAYVSSSTYNNRDVGSAAGLGIEYNIFPYSESTRRILRLKYWVYSYYYDYIEETIFFKTNEWLFPQSFTAALTLIQPWGSVTSQVYARNFINEMDHYRLSWYNQLSLNLVEGLSFEISGRIQKIADQLALRRGDASQADVLLLQQELATSYDYWLNFGISYTFGSIYNNIVNPRMWN